MHDVQNRYSMLSFPTQKPFWQSSCRWIAHCTLLPPKRLGTLAINYPVCAYCFQIYPSARPLQASLSNIMPPSPQWETCNVSCKLGGTRWPHAVPASVNPSRGHSGTCWSLWLRCFNTIYALLGAWLQQIISEILDILQPGSEHRTPVCGRGCIRTFLRIWT